MAEKNQALSYTEGYKQDHEYTHDSGVVVLPVAGRTAKHRRIRLHGGIGHRIVRWEASRLGKPPLAPKPETIGDTILSTCVHAHLPIPSPGSNAYLFRMSGEYVFVQDSPRVVGVNALPTGAHPYPVEPMDTVAETTLGSALSQSPPTTIAEFDTVVEALQNRVVNSGASDFVWPLTVFPIHFTGNLLMG